MKKGIAVIALLFFLLAVGIAFSANHIANNKNNDKVDEEVEELLKENDEVSVIVVLEDDYDVLDAYSASELNDADDFEKKKIMIEEQQEKVLEGLDLKEEDNANKNKIGILSADSYDFKLENKFSSVNGFSGEVTEEGLEKLKNDPKVKKIDLNYPTKITLSDTAKIVNATNTWKLIYNNTNLTGKGETICVVDTGIDYTHPDLGGCTTVEFLAGTCNKVIGGYDIKDNDDDPLDEHGHGTYIAGVISANGTIRGIAPDSKLIAIKDSDASGGGTVADLISGMEWCVNNASKFNISVISISSACTSAVYSAHCDALPLCNNDQLSNVVGLATKNNISVVAASGNDRNTTYIRSPACITNVTAVGATDKSDNVASYSNRNSITDLFAPGSSITTTNKGGGSISKDGTSLSTPHVAAAFALIHQYFKLTENKVVMPNETQRYLNNTGKRISDSGSGLTFSRINIFEAIKSLDKLSPNITITNPQNNSIRTNLTFIVNIISNEVLSNATLEINNTNYTMSGSGLSWSANISSIRNGTYTFKAYGNDSFGNRNVSSTFTISIDLIAPYWSNNITNVSDINNIRKDDLIQFNVTWNDTVDLSSFIFSWNDTGLWQNITNGSLSGKSRIVSTNRTITAARGSAIGYKFYANDSANNFNETDTWIFSIANTIPLVLNVTINSSDELNRTNATLLGIFSYSDTDNDALSGNETKWYNNSVEYNLTANLTSISAKNTTKGQNWIFSVRVYDGFNWSEWANSTKITIRNAKPEINITLDSITANETQRINITINASDIDNDALTFRINDSSKFNLSGIYFIWNTNLNDAGNYAFNITVNDTELVDSKIINVIVLDARDLDNDGNPDFNDTDDDNDNINDENDFLLGNVSNINSTSNLNLSLTVNGTTNLAKLFNGTFPIIITANVSNNLTNETLRLVELEYTFNSSNILDFGKITTNYSTTGFSGISLRGFTRPSNSFTKNFTIDKVNSTAKAVCIKDADTSFESISSACNGNNEFLVNCNNVTSNGYTCFDTGIRYKITGLNHSALKELCVDNDGDGFGNGCAAGSDGCDTDKSTSGSCPSGGGDSGGGGGGGGGDSGGGGGGGGGVFYICNMDWSCTSWSKCENGWETRECSFVKVPQHTTNESCASVDNVPQRAKKCKAIVQENKTIEKTASVLDKDSEGKSGAGITGAAVKDIEKANMSIGVPITVITVLVGILIYLLLFKKKNEN